MVYFPITARAPRGKYPFEVAVLSESSTIFNVYCKFKVKHSELTILENFYQLAEEASECITSNRLNAAIQLQVSEFPRIDIREQRLSGLRMNRAMLKWLSTFPGCSLLKPAPLNSKVRGRLGNYRLFEDDDLPSYELIAVFKVKAVDRIYAQNS
ncbi:hypothetical protein [Ewingella americana]|uniref:hypothetical protein n=1 Tax=Ewingella americana TaxID=41202 RepID=UPI00112A7A5A|nr:hypothetical protein [Ewingella americana]